MRSLEELVEVSDPALPLVEECVRTAARNVEVLDCDAEAGKRSLLHLQVTARSPMGAIALHIGGLMVDFGWVRVLGAGCARLPRSIDGWNHMKTPGTAPGRIAGGLVVGDDVLGGVFAINGGGLPGRPGEVAYFAPDCLEWEGLGVGYSSWLEWLLNGDLDGFYENQRWPKWEQEVMSLAGDRAFSIYPFLFADGPSIAERSRRDVPCEELWRLYVQELPRQLRG